MTMEEINNGCIAIFLIVFFGAIVIVGLWNMHK